MHDFISSIKFPHDNLRECYHSPFIEEGKQSFLTLYIMFSKFIHVVDG